MKEINGLTLRVGMSFIKRNTHIVSLGTTNGNKIILETNQERFLLDIPGCSDDMNPGHLRRRERKFVEIVDDELRDVIQHTKERDEREK